MLSQLVGSAATRLFTADWKWVRFSTTIMVLFLSAFSFFLSFSPTVDGFEVDPYAGLTPEMGIMRWKCNENFIYIFKTLVSKSSQRRINFASTPTWDYVTTTFFAPAPKWNGRKIEPFFYLAHCRAHRSFLPFFGWIIKPLE